MIEKAIRLAALAHEGQKDKAGAPYILHPLRVMLLFSEEEYQILAVLHDVLEDSSFTIEDLRKEGFSPKVLEALSFLTKKEGEGYSAYIERVLQNEMAAKVKLRDLEDNMRLKRIPNPSQKDRERFLKYKKAYERIKGEIEKEGL